MLTDSCRILIVEDDVDYVEIVTDQLRTGDYQISHVRTMAEALSAVADHEFDVVLLDLGLPDVIDVPNIARIHEVRPALPVIVITAQVHDAAAYELIRLGAQDYLTKGEFGAETLRRTISYAIERTELALQLQLSRNDAERAAREEAVISNIGRIISSNSDIELTFGRFASELRHLIQFDRVWVMLRQEDEGSFAELYAAGMDVEGNSVKSDAPLTGSVSELVLAHSEGLIISAADVAAGGRMTERGQTLMNAGLTSFVSQPLQNMGVSIGLVTLASKTENAYSPDHLVLLGKVASQIAGPVAQAETWKKLKRLAETQSTLAELGKAISQSLVLEEIAESAAGFISELLPAPHISLNLVDKSAGTYSRRYIYGPEIDGYPELKSSSLEGSTTYQVVETNSPMVLGERDLASAKQPAVKLAFQAGIRSALIVPLKVEGQAIGTIAWADYVDEQFGPADLDLAVTISMQLAGAIANCALHDRTLQHAEEQLALERLEASNQELQVANEVKSQIISNVSHELRTPLTSMLAFADMLNRDTDGVLPEQYKVMVRMIRRAGRQLDLLIGDLLTMSRLQSGDFNLNYESFDLNKLLGDIADLMSSICVSKNQEIVLEIEDEDIELVADRSRFAQVIQNIISNASKYSPEDSKITVSARYEEETVVVSVSDQGAGMSGDDLRKLFQRFSRLDNDATRSVQGTGLGLHIVEKLVSLHSGEVRVQSKPGEGTTFAVHMPSRCSAAESRSVA